jgi:hypothetical protein
MDLLNQRNYWHYRNLDRAPMRKKYPIYDPQISNQAQEIAAFDGADYCLFNTKATLVMCPNHLLKQWTEELTKYSSMKLNRIGYFCFVCLFLRFQFVVSFYLAHSQV